MLLSPALSGRISGMTVKEYGCHLFHEKIKNERTALVGSFLQRVCTGGLRNMIFNGK